MIQHAFGLLTDPAAWGGPTGFGQRIAEHLWLSLIALIPAILIGVPLGAAIGHTGKGRGLAVGTTGAMRALPSLGLLTVLALLIPSGIANAWIPSTIVLLILAVPPILAGTYSGIEAIGRDIVQASRAIGHTELQTLGKVEMPLAGASIVDGIRSATLQVIATTTICAYLGTGGLGRLLIDGLATRNYPQVVAGAVLVIGVVVAVELILLGLVYLLRRRS
ncbi:ABC transporter permease [Corynebacterium heidelbergense]|uniref:ABC transporter permease n=1 Tax=Corynebacterium heidelbergense TaxID=2055947 RepID=A0A364V4I8_9CORY|nr:ABC transporter permease subunit [Corynebacterium heidelbergense]RAV31570.1 ABC transporter permease [Corynebacterium heidelbergense]